MEKSFLFRLVYVLNMLWFFVQSGTRCSRNKSKSWNNNIYLTKSSDTIYSPDYDTHDTYPANMSCTWLISLPKNKIQLSFSAFDLQAPGPSCQHGDFVEVRDGEYPDSPVLGTFCGSVIPSDTFSSGSYMLVQFRSDESMEKRGFVTSYRSYDTSIGCKSYEIWPSSGSTSSQTDLHCSSFSAAAICVGVAVVLAILVAAVFGVSVMKKWTLHSPGRVKIYRTLSGITIKIFPATPKEPRREVSLNNEIVTAPSSLVPPKAWSRFRRLSSWIKW